MRAHSYCYHSLFVLLCLAPTSQSIAQTQPHIITQDDLHPFCTSRYIRENFNATVERCLDVGLICAKETFAEQEGSHKMTDKLYSCVFNRL